MCVSCFTAGFAWGWRDEAEMLRQIGGNQGIAPGSCAEEWGQSGWLASGDRAGCRPGREWSSGALGVAGSWLAETESWVSL